MKCQDVMKTDVVCCGMEESVSTIAARMRDREVGFMPVCDDNGNAVGTVTDRDLVLRVMAEMRSLVNTQAKDVMTRGVIACRPSDSLSVAEDLMSQHQVSRIVCMADDGGRPVGIISLSDVAEVENRGQASEVLRSVAEREAHS